MPKVLITGSNGLLGQKLVSLLASTTGYEVVATGRGENRNPKGNYQYVTMDITSSRDVQQVVSNHKPDFVVNTAAMTHVDQCQLNQEDCWKQNVTAVEYLVRACDTSRAFLLHLSTDFIFDGASGPYREDDQPNPLSYYAESKLASEEILKKSSIKWAIARTMLVYGIAHDMSRSNIILWVKENLENKKPIKVVNDQWRMPTLAEDLAIGCKQIIDHSAEGVFHLSGKDLLTPYDIAIKTADFFGLDKSLITEVDGSIFTQPAKRPAKTGFILDKARNKINYEPRAFEEGLRVLASQIA
jgi:dTDP-4-dehydrorhamnose reductase